MRKPKELKWLYEELPDLIDRGILSSDVADRLKAHYGPAEDEPAYNLAFIIIGILGAVLIGGGIILIFAYNWDYMSRTWRTIFSFLPLIIAQLIYGYTFFKKRDSIAWVESASGFLMLMLAASIALISQTYNLGGSIESFLFTWMILSIPLLYLMNASLPAVFYLVGIASWSINVNGSPSVAYWAFLLAAVPHLYFNIKPNEPTNRGHLLGWILVFTLAVAYVNVVEMRLMNFSTFGVSIMLTFMYIIGQEIYYKSKSVFQRPFQSFTVAAIFMASLILTYTYPSRSSLGWIRNYESWAATINIVVLALAVLTIAALVYQHWKKQRKLNWFVLVFPLVILLINLLTQNEYAEVGNVLANIYLFGFGLYYVWEGIEEQKIGLVNLGMLFVSAIIVARFFDTDWSFIVKGIVFVVLGISFLLINFRLAKRFVIKK